MEKKYTVERLKEHEFNYWKNHHEKSNFPNTDFYVSFFDFEELNGKKVLDIGCGGYPVSEYNPKIENLTLMDPLLEDLINLDKFSHLKKYGIVSKGILDENKEIINFDFVICLNVIDHFYDDEIVFAEKFRDFLSKGGKLYLQYDVRSEDDGEHISVNDEKIIEKIGDYFEIEKISHGINPICVGWSKVFKSTRIIAKKK